jgi:hypothetical protein
LANNQFIEGSRMAQYAVHVAVSPTARRRSRWRDVIGPDATHPDRDGGLFTV